MNKGTFYLLAVLLGAVLTVSCEKEVIVEKIVEIEKPSLTREVHFEVLFNSNAGEQVEVDINDGVVVSEDESLNGRTVIEDGDVLKIEADVRFRFLFSDGKEIFAPALFTFYNVKTGNEIKNGVLNDGNHQWPAGTRVLKAVKDDLTIEFTLIVE